MKKYLLLPLITASAISCATQELYLNVTQPAPVTIAPEIKIVGIIDRSNPTDKTKSIDKMDQLLTLEGDVLDSIGTREAIKGVTEELTENDRFNEVKLLTNLNFQTSAVGSLPSPLTWAQVENICRENGTDALFALEMYDTDTRINYSVAKTQVSTPLGDIPALEHTASMDVLVKTGWRIYSPADRTVLDEYIVPETVNFTGRGINPVVAVSALMNREAAVKEVSNRAGHIYALRLIPYRLRATRDYFVKGTDNFKTAKRKAQLGQWDEAALLWEKETGNPDPKVAGRAHYNMAIINEINGDLDKAVEWAQKSYSDYGTRQGLDYVRILENRQYNAELLEYQEQR